MIIHTLPFSEPCDGCDGHTEIMTATPGRYLAMCLDTASIGDRVYCTRCDCSGTIEATPTYGQYVDWGLDVCQQCQDALMQKLNALAQRIRELVGCDSVVITREQ